MRDFHHSVIIFLGVTILQSTVGGVVDYGSFKTV